MSVSATFEICAAGATPSLLGAVNDGAVTAPGQVVAGVVFPRRWRQTPMTRPAQAPSGRAACRYDRRRKRPAAGPRS